MSKLELRTNTQQGDRLRCSLPGVAPAEAEQQHANERGCRQSCQQRAPDTPALASDLYRDGAEKRSRLPQDYHAAILRLKCLAVRLRKLLRRLKAVLGPLIERFQDNLVDGRGNSGI